MPSKPTPSPASAPSRRTRTDPTLKWLLNERAAIAGSHASATEAIPRLERRVQRAEFLLKRAQHQLAAARSAAAQAETKLQAFDSTIGQLNSDANPAAAGTVRAWLGRYGERGALTAFLQERVKCHAPNPVSLSTLLNEVELHFGISHFEPIARKKLRYSVRTCLRQLHAKLGSVQPYRPTANCPQGMWVWAEVSSFDQLKQQASQAKAGIHEYDPFAQFSAPSGSPGSAPAGRSAPAHEHYKPSAAPRGRRAPASHQDPARNQVDGERARGREG